MVWKTLSRKLRKTGCQIGRKTRSWKLRKRHGIGRKTGSRKLWEMVTKNVLVLICFVVSCFAAWLEVIIEENIKAMKREATKKILDEAIAVKRAPSLIDILSVSYISF